jgi:hypothetical protein
MSRPREMSCWSSERSTPASMDAHRPFCGFCPEVPAARTCREGVRGGGRGQGVSGSE